MTPEVKEKSKTPLFTFLERLYRLKTFKYQQLEEHYFILEKPMDISDIVERCKKWCVQHNCRFMGVRPMFEIMKDD